MSDRAHLREAYSLREACINNVSDGTYHECDLPKGHAPKTLHMCGVCGVYWD